MYIVRLKDCWGVKVYVQPKASRTRIVGLHDGMLKLAVSAPPVEGKANKEVVSFFSRIFKIPKKQIEISSGVQSRKKIVVVGDADEDSLRNELDPYVSWYSGQPNRR